MINTLEAARKEFDVALDALESAKVKTTAARAALDGAEEAERNAHALVASARQRISELEAEPRAAAELAAVVYHLKALLDATPTYPGDVDSRSPTRSRVRRELVALENDNASSSASKLARAKGLAHAFESRYTLDRAKFDAAEAQNHAQRLRGG